jgi:hypothetical protein
VACTEGKSRDQSGCRFLRRHWYPAKEYTPRLLLSAAAIGARVERARAHAVLCMSAKAQSATFAPGSTGSYTIQISEPTSGLLVDPDVPLMGPKAD